MKTTMKTIQEIKTLLQKIKTTIQTIKTLQNIKTKQYNLYKQ